MKNQSNHVKSFVIRWKVYMLLTSIIQHIKYKFKWKWNKIKNLNLRKEKIKKEKNYWSNGEEWLGGRLMYENWILGV